MNNLSLMQRSLAQSDPEIAAAIANETTRQAEGLELIASENFVSTAVLEAAGSVMTNKYAEGYPGKRYYGGCEFVDVAETLAIARAKALFGADHVNVQPHSGAQANMAVYLTLLKPGDVVLGMNLAHGGHLTHGHPLNFSGKLYTIVPYGVRQDDERLDYEEFERLAHEHKPKMIIAGASAYSRVFDFERMGKVARAVGAPLMVDMAHIAGLVAGGQHPSPVPHHHHTQDAARSAWRHGDVPRTVRQGSRPHGIPRRAGRSAHAHHRGQGSVLPRSGNAGVRRIPTATGRQREALVRGHGCGRLPHCQRRHRQPHCAG